MIRPARSADAEDQRAVERTAGARFVDVGMTEIAEAEPMSIDDLVSFARAGRSWVATDEHGRAVGYLVVELVDGSSRSASNPATRGRGSAER